MTKRILITGLMVVAAGAVLVALATVSVFGKILPGVKIAGVSVGGMTAAGAENIIKQELNEDREYVFSYTNRVWKLNSSDWNLKIDYPGTVNKAMSAGRNQNSMENLWNRFIMAKNGYWVEPIASWDETRLEQKVENILAEIEIPPMEPQITLGDDKKVSVSSGQNGVLVNRRLLMDRIKNDFYGKEKVGIEIPASEVKPAIAEELVAKARDRAQKMVGKKLTVINPETKQKWEVDDKQILFWMKPTLTDWQNDKIVQWLNDLASSVSKPAQNASFTFVTTNKLEGFKPEVWGTALNTPGSFEKVAEALAALEGGDKTANVELVVVKIPPEITLGQVNNLGLKELLGRGESWFSGSITNRIYNLKKASAELNGAIIPPGETFSFNKQIGEVSSDTGYKQAYVIKEGKTILGDGGGVCQVSSTLFRAVLAAGLPVVERTAHAYRVHYYEEKYQVGFDATVFQPSPDFKFKNDTPAYLLIQMVYDEKAKYLAFEIYGTSDGRITEVSKSRIWDQTPPPPDLYVDDPTLPVGQVTQTEHPAWGAKVAFDYKVTRGNELLQNRTFYSVYKPWQAVYLRGVKPL